jgi:hypothetical protein
MNQGIELVPLKCVKCGTAVPAAPDEVAWACANCGQGLLLDEGKGLLPIEVRYVAAAQETGVTGKPFWVGSGRVTFQRRMTYGRQQGPDERWQQQQTFVLPAYECSLEEAGALGMGFLRQPPPLVAGPKGILERVTVDAQGAKALAEFVVLTVEAERRDQLKEVAFDLALDPPTLWVLPFALKDGKLFLAAAR